LIAATATGCCGSRPALDSAHPVTPRGGVPATTAAARAAGAGIAVGLAALTGLSLYKQAGP
jgi:hypothetical protein